MNPQMPYTFGDGVRYDINISNDGDAAAEIIYRWVFETHVRNPNTFLYNTGAVSSLADTDLNIYQTYDLFRVKPGQKAQRLLNDELVAPSGWSEARAHACTVEPSMPPAIATSRASSPGKTGTGTSKVSATTRAPNSRRPATIPRNNPRPGRQAPSPTTG